MIHKPHRNNLSNIYPKILTNLILFCIIFSNISCKKFIDIPAPKSQLVDQNVFAEDGTAAAVLTGIYTEMRNGGFSTGSTSISILCGLSGDELNNYSTQGIPTQCYKNALTSLDVPFWTDLYNKIYVANAAIEGLTKTSSLTETIKNQLLGEAKFVRAFCYFYLVNLFDDVPLITTTNYQTNARAKRETKENVYVQIITDLKEAKEQLNTSYLAGDCTTKTTQRVRPNRSTASALLSRVYLYTKDWINADAEATSIINTNDLYQIESDIDKVFLKDSKEAIWQLEAGTDGYNTLDADIFILLQQPDAFYHNVSLSKTLVNSFDSKDLRKKSWISEYNSGNEKYYYAYKYKVPYNFGGPISEFLIVFRLAEQYLIRAEARLQQGKLNLAIQDINIIRQRAGLENISTITKEEILSEILEERKLELFTEWGHRWFDLKRSGKIDDVMQVISFYKGTIWNTNWKLYPIPLKDIQNNSNLSQNKGYN